MWEIQAPIWRATFSDPSSPLYIDFFSLLFSNKKMTKILKLLLVFYLKLINIALIL